MNTVEQKVAGLHLEHICESCDDRTILVNSNLKFANKTVAPWQIFEHFAFVQKAPELQIRGGIQDNSKIIFLTCISQQKHML